MVRADSLARSMARYLRERIEQDPNVKVLFGHEVRELEGEGHLKRITIEYAPTGERRTLKVGALVILIVAPQRAGVWLVC